MAGCGGGRLGLGGCGCATSLGRPGRQAPPSPGVPKHARLRVSGCGRGGAYGPPPQPNPTRPGGRGIDSESRGMTSHKVRRGERVRCCRGGQGPRIIKGGLMS